MKKRILFSILFIAVFAANAQHIRVSQIKSTDEPAGKILTTGGDGKVVISGVNISSLFSGSYTDLANKPTLFSGSYLDLTNKPSLFDGTWTSLSGKPSFATVATSGSYTDLINKPFLPRMKAPKNSGKLYCETDCVHLPRYPDTFL